MKANTKVTLFDNPSRFGTGTCWSPNVWKTRLFLNYKNIDYDTEWLNGPDFRILFQSFGIPPHPAGTELNDYTIPAVRLPDGTYVMESKRIALVLEERHPAPSLHLDDPLLARVETLRKQFGRYLQAYLVPRMPRECLLGLNCDWHREQRKKTYGMSLEEYEAKNGGDLAWERAEPYLKETAEILNQNGDGPFVLGREVSYADFIIVSWLEWCRVLGGDCLERFFRVDPAFERVYEACKPWLERNDR